jgi:NAD-specific glutamate dehydrogenase
MLSRDLVHVDRNISKVFASVGLQLTHAIVEEVTPVSKATANLIERAANSVMYARDAKSVARMMKGYIDSGLPRDIAAQLVAERQGLRTVMDSNFRISGKGARGARPFLDARH